MRVRWRLFSNFGRLDPDLLISLLSVSTRPRYIRHIRYIRYSCLTVSKVDTFPVCQDLLTLCSCPIDSSRVLLSSIIIHQTSFLPWALPSTGSSANFFNLPFSLDPSSKWINDMLALLPFVGTGSPTMKMHWNGRSAESISNNDRSLWWIQTPSTNPPERHPEPTTTGSGLGSLLLPILLFFLPLFVKTSKLLPSKSRNSLAPLSCKARYRRTSHQRFCSSVLFCLLRSLKSISRNGSSMTRYRTWAQFSSFSEGLSRWWTSYTTGWDMAPERGNKIGHFLENDKDCEVGFLISYLTPFF